MPFTNTGMRLLSSLRRTGSASALYEVREELFTEDEAALLAFLRDYHRQHQTFPGPKTFREETGHRLPTVREPLDFYIGKAQEKSLIRSVYDPYKALREAIANEDAEEIAEIIADMSRIRNLIGSDVSRGTLDWDTAIDMVVRDFIEAENTPGLRGITTGWEYVDSQTGGHQNSDLNTFIARPGEGKTTTLLHQAHSARNEGEKVLFMSNEMGGLQIARRSVGMLSGINPNYLKEGRLSTGVRSRVMEIIDNLKGDDRFTYIVGNFEKSVDSVRAFAHELVPDIIYVDASYLLKPEKKRGRDTRRENIGDVIEELKKIALEMNRPIVQTVQFNRQAVKPKSGRMRNPIAHLDLTKIGETDIIGQVSSVVVGMAKPEGPLGRIRRHMGFLKGRDGEDGWWTINYKFQPPDFSLHSVGHDVETTETEAGDIADIDLDSMI